MIGQDPLNRERIWQGLARLERAGYLPIFATSAIDVALWDIAGKALGQPVWRLLGGYRDRLPAYASSAHMETLGAYLRELEDVGRAAIGRTRSTRRAARTRTSRSVGPCARRRLGRTSR